MGDDELGATYVNVGEGEAFGDELAVAGDVGLAGGLTFAVLVGAGVAAEVAEPETDADGAADGENIAGCVDEAEPVHAATAVETRTVNVAVLTAEAARIFIAPPCMSGGEQHRFRPADLTRGSADGVNCWSSDHCPRRLRQVCVQWRDFHLTIRLRE